MGDLHAVDLLLGPDAVVGGVLPHFLLRVELGHVQGMAVGGQLEMHNGAGPVTQALPFLGGLARVGGLDEGDCVCGGGGKGVCVREGEVRTRHAGRQVSHPQATPLLTSVLVRFHGRAQVANGGVGVRRNKKGTWRGHGRDMRHLDGGAGGAQERGCDDAAASGQHGTDKHDRGWSGE